MVASALWAKKTKATDRISRNEITNLWIFDAMFTPPRKLLVVAAGLYISRQMILQQLQQGGCGVASDNGVAEERERMKRGVLKST